VAEEGTNGARRIIRYYVDEAGDPVLFNRRGQVMVGQPGCSRFFILGVLWVGEPKSLRQQLRALRAELLADPYFNTAPSMQPQAKKTAVLFHAKDDLPEIRYRVFDLLRARSDLKFMACVKDKYAVLQYVRQRERHDEGYRYRQNELYDYVVRRLFKTLLHKADEYRICFARRGTSDRTRALREQLEAARDRFVQQWGKSVVSRITVVGARPAEDECLQAADYFLWAIQRLYEKQEERFVAALREAISLVIDVDDPRHAPKGAYYNRRRPLTLAAVQGRLGDMGEARP